MLKGSATHFFVASTARPEFDMNHLTNSYALGFVKIAVSLIPCLFLHNLISLQVERAFYLVTFHQVHAITAAPMDICLVLTAGAVI